MLSIRAKNAVLFQEFADQLTIDHVVIRRSEQRAKPPG
jgi:hypothetical protein